MLYMIFQNNGLEDSNTQSNSPYVRHLTHSHEDSSLVLSYHSGEHPIFLNRLNQKESPFPANNVSAILCQQNQNHSNLHHMTDQSALGLSDFLGTQKFHKIESQAAKQNPPSNEEETNNHNVIFTEKKSHDLSHQVNV